MTINEAFFELKNQNCLTKNEIFEVLAFINHQDYQWIVNHLDHQLINFTEYQKILTGLQTKIPLAYLLNQKQFYGEDFYVDERVLIPRPETEILVSSAVKWLSKNPQAQVLDLATGSGVLGLTLKKHFPTAEVYLSDISTLALEVAKINAQQQHLKVNYLTGDFLTPILDEGLKFDLIICNPPYIDLLDPDVDPQTKFEPSLALFAQNDGLEFFEKLFASLPLIINNPNHFCLIMEFGWKQKPALEELVQRYFAGWHLKIDFQKDYSNLWRCIIIRSNI